MRRKILSVILLVVMLVSMLPIGLVCADEAPLTVTDNVIDITDRNVWSWSRYYAKATDIRLTGADVSEATEDGTTVNIVLTGNTNPDAEISVEFGTALNKGKMSGHTATVALSGGEAQIVMQLRGEYERSSTLNGSVTYTLNFSLGASPTELPAIIKDNDSISAYCGAINFGILCFLSSSNNS